MTGASLAVAIALIALAALSWLRLWAQPGDDAVAHAARNHLTPLAQWALGALALHALCLIGSGSTGVGGYALTAVLAVAATVLQFPPAAADDVTVEEEREAAEPAPAAPAPARPGGTPLWAGPRDQSTSRAGLWND